jgi:hypothetical protein
LRLPLMVEDETINPTEGGTIGLHCGSLAHNVILLRCAEA